MTIFAEDNRCEVADTTAEPYAAIVRIVATFADGSTYVGTGAMVDDDHVLTSGHLIHDRDAGGWAVSITVTPAQDGDVAPYGSANATTLRSTTGWTVAENLAFDWGLITLDREIGDQTGWFDMVTYRNTVAYRGLEVDTAGYPGDLDAQADSMYGTSGTITSADRYELYSRIDVWNGQSGSPVWVDDPTGRDDLLGIVDWGSSSTNGFTRVTDQMIQLVEAWERQDDLRQDDLRQDWGWSAA